MGVLETIASDWVLVGGALSANATETAEGSKSASLTEPATNATSGRFVIPSFDDQDKPIHWAITFPTADAENETFSANVWGWTKIKKVGETDGEWIPNLLLSISGTAGATTGVSGGVLGSTVRLPDTLAVDTDNTRGSSAEVGGGTSAGDGVLYVSFDSSGHQLIEVETGRDNSAAAVGVLARPL